MSGSAFSQACRSSSYLRSPPSMPGRAAREINPCPVSRRGGSQMLFRRLSDHATRINEPPTDPHFALRTRLGSLDVQVRAMAFNWEL